MLLPIVNPPLPPANAESVPQRVISITCLLYGSNQAKYEALMTKLGVPKPRLAKCVRDYKARYAAWDQLLEPYHRAKKQQK